jgi:hypothetical protein
MKKGCPISPEKVVSLKRLSVPPEVFDAFNECITNAWDGDCANFTRERVINAIAAKAGPIYGQELFWKCYRDVLIRYEDQGWSVVYNMPDIDEGVKAYFLFKIK